MRLRFMAVGLAVAGLTLAACGSSSSGGSSTSSSAQQSSSTTSSSSTVTTYNDPQYGKILTSGSGVTYYIFTKDTRNHSNCTGACAKAWPPVYGSSFTAAGGVSKSLIGTTMRASGKSQLTYDGHPLYTFSGDSGPHMVSGEGVNGFGGYWYVISPSGKVIASSPSSGSYGGSTYGSSSSQSSSSGW
jgi:predicted lipoprotein with Yx(FWY)xxD motif